MDRRNRAVSEPDSLAGGLIFCVCEPAHPKPVGLPPGFITMDSEYAHRL
jgi:hypothetical protein